VDGGFSTESTGGVVITKTHDFLWRQDTKLNLLYFADRRRGIGELVSQHGARNSKLRSYVAVVAQKARVGFKGIK
jgi:hypothetical protein